MRKTVAFYFYLEDPPSGDLKRLDYLVEIFDNGKKTYFLNGDSNLKVNFKDLESYRNKGNLKDIRNRPIFNANYSIWLDSKGIVYYAPYGNPFEPRTRRIIDSISIEEREITTRLSEMLLHLEQANMEVMRHDTSRRLDESVSDMLVERLVGPSDEEIEVEPEPDEAIET